ncbi:lipase family protein [Marinivivus vitaminiproducens]|uniref:lipase family protein n=1 Tax=Marinivivus vitaminiproducens TaxID=3035935 RepID=UPI00279F7830|nr:DUF2974 domain-containing protein [Geminicoccaceae bacterium SCSIO 64248]
MIINKSDHFGVSHHMKKSIITLMLALSACTPKDWHHNSDNIYFEGYRKSNTLDTKEAYVNLSELVEMAVLSAASYQRDDSLDLDCGASKYKLLNYKNLPQLTVNHKHKNFHWDVPGLRYRIWLNETASKQKIVVAFRGTDGIGGWVSNFRVLQSFLPFVNDHYEQVREITPRIIRNIKKAYPTAELIATGHSLGGGLAEQAAYWGNGSREESKEPSGETFSKVYGFNPSIVTGRFTTDERIVKNATFDLNVYRIFERGDLLQTFSLLLNNFVPLGQENPRVSEVIFNFNSNRDGTQSSGDHSINRLSCNLADAFHNLPGTAVVARENADDHS